MKRNSIYVYIAASLAMLVPVPGRFACGIIIVLLFNLLMFTGTLFRYSIRALKLDSQKTVLLTVELITVTILAKQILTYISPVLSLTLGFSLFLPTLSSVIIGYFFDHSERILPDELKANMIQSSIFSLFALVFFLLRDMFGYGTFTLPSFRGLKVWYMPFSHTSFSVLAFIASIPGALILIAVILAVLMHINNKLSCIERLEK